jgi:outer membrane autotransporter protein
MLAITLLAFGNSAHATCDADGSITGANGPIVLGTAGCATNPGVMSGTVDSGAAVAAPGSTGVTSVASPSWAVTNHGTITADGNGVTGDASFRLTNSGMITAGDSGALIGGGSTVVNSFGGTIAGGFTGLSISGNGGSTSGGPSMVDNAGTISSTGGFNDAIDLGLGGTVTNQSTGTISATGVGVAGANNPTIVNNLGQILDASTAIGLSAGGTVTNALGAVISSSSRGVDISGGVGAVVNSGSILASEGRAVQLQAGGSVTNTSTGTITSQDAGTRAIYIFGGPATIINAGSVNGGVTAAVEVESTQSSITNSGTINSPSGVGIQLDATSASNTLTTIVNDSGGAIQGAVDALVANGNASVDFTNRGEVIGDMVFGAGDVALHFYTGSSLIGNLTAGTGIDTISLNGSGNGAFSSPIANFQTITKLDDGTWTLSGVVSGVTALNVTQGTLILSAANAYTGGTTISAGTLQLGNDGTTGSILGDVTNNGALAFDRSDTMTFAGAISGSGAVAQIGSGTTILTADNPYTGGTTISAGTLVVGDFSHPTAALSGGGPIAVAAGGTLGGYGSVTGSVTNSGIIAAGNATPGFAGSPIGTFTVIGNLLNQGDIQLASGESVGNVLEVRGGYIGASGTMAINTFLGGDGSPSDRLVINGDPAATGNTSVHVTNIGGPGAETTNGIQVVSAINGATTAPGAFTLANGELRAGAFDYDLFRGGVNGGSANDWFLRSSFVVPPIPPEPPIPPIPPFPPNPPPDPLPPGIYPIIGPELATYGVVQPLARQLGLSILGTLDDRVGDTYDGCAVAPAPETSSVDLPTKKPAAVPTKKPGPAPCPLFSPSVWGRFFGQTVDNHYQAFADPRVSGNLGGFQGGIDVLRGSLIAGYTERAGLYGAYGDVNSDVTGLVTNPAATAYILTHTGSMSLNAWSAGGYWTHVGPGGWYLDAVLQETWYGGSASTEFARLDTDGTGFIASLEGGYPFSWPQLGPGFVIEPQGQILWQKVSFRHDYDGLGDVALGDTTGPSGRMGLRTKWTVATAGGQVWQPYLRANVWRDWGAEADAVYSGTDVVPLATQATMLEFGGGLTGRINANVSVFANVGYECAVGAGDDKRNGVQGGFGAKYTW